MTASAGRGTGLGRPGRPGRLAAALAGLVLAAASCAGPRNGLNTATSACFKTLPLARGVVNQQGRLVGVRSVLGTTLAKHLPQAAPLGTQRLCVVAFHGPYAAGAVRDADPAGPGEYAVVAVDGRGRSVLAAFVVDVLPLRFRHRL